MKEVEHFRSQIKPTLPGGNTGALGSVVPGFTPDLRKFENRAMVALIVKF